MSKKNNKQQGLEKDFEKEVQQELGYVSGLFMSQKCKGTEIIMPTTELKEVSDRIGLYLFEAISKERTKVIGEIEDIIENKSDSKEHDTREHYLAYEEAIDDILANLKDKEI